VLCAEAGALCDGDQMPAWRIILFAFVGKILASLFVAVCVVLGFGPTQWAEFLISGMPIFITPGIARLVFLLFASLTLASLLWEKSSKLDPCFPKSYIL
jgi:hypothetical protein